MYSTTIFTAVALVKAVPPSVLSVLLVSYWTTLHCIPIYSIHSVDIQPSYLLPSNMEYLASFTGSPTPECKH